MGFFFFREKYTFTVKKNSVKFTNKSWHKEIRITTKMLTTVNPTPSFLPLVKPNSLNSGEIKAWNSFMFFSSLLPSRRLVATFFPISCWYIADDTKLYLFTLTTSVDLRASCPWGPAPGPEFTGESQPLYHFPLLPNWSQC